MISMKWQTVILLALWADILRHFLICLHIEMQDVIEAVLYLDKVNGTSNAGTLLANWDLCTEYFDEQIPVLTDLNQHK